MNGLHGIVYVHNACNTRFDKQARQSLVTMLYTLSNNETRKEMNERISFVMNQCTSSEKRVLYKTFSVLACKQFQLCNIPIFWYDDYESETWSNNYRKFYIAYDYMKRMLLNKSEISWRDGITTWFDRLPMNKVEIPLETEREQLKREAIVKVEEVEVQMETLESSISCLSGSSQIIDKKLGVVEMRHLKIGSQVATISGWATVKTFLHWHSNETVDALQIDHAHGRLTLSPDHLIFTVDNNGAAQSKAAKHLRSGDLLLTDKSSSSLVQSVHQTTMQGYYAPLTSSGTIIVDNISVSCYSQDHHHLSLPHWVAQVAMVPIRTIPAWMSYVPDEGNIHPYARFLQFFWDIVNRAFLYLTLH